MPVRAFLDSDRPGCAVVIGIGKSVSMPVRAFLDSDPIRITQLNSGAGVSIPVRAFLDSDESRMTEEVKALVSFNARQGIS